MKHISVQFYMRGPSYEDVPVPVESSFGTLDHSPELETHPQWKRGGECHMQEPDWIIKTEIAVQIINT